MRFTEMGPGRLGNWYMSPPSSSRHSFESGMHSSWLSSKSPSWRRLKRTRQIKQFISLRSKYRIYIGTIMKLRCTFIRSGATPGASKTSGFSIVENITYAFCHEREFLKLLTALCTICARSSDNQNSLRCPFVLEIGCSNQPKLRQAF